MTFELRKHNFGNAFPLATLVLVDMRKAYLSSAPGLRDSVAAGVLYNCRTVLAFARKTGYPIAFVSGSGEAANIHSSDEWIKNFEPQRMDAVFNRRSVSCYSSPYFAEGMAQTGGAIVLAGFLGRGGCLSTAADAFLAGHRVTILSNAIMDDAAASVFDDSTIRLLNAFTKFDIRVLSTSAWMETVKPWPVEARTAWDGYSS